MQTRQRGYFEQPQGNREAQGKQGIREKTQEMEEKSWGRKVYGNNGMEWIYNFVKGQ